MNEGKNYISDRGSGYKSSRKLNELTIVLIQYISEDKITVINPGTGTELDNVSLALPPGMYLTTNQWYIGYLLKNGNGVGHVIPLTSQFELSKYEENLINKDEVNQTTTPKPDMEVLNRSMSLNLSVETVPSNSVGFKMGDTRSSVKDGSVTWSSGLCDMELTKAGIKLGGTNINFSDTSPEKFRIGKHYINNKTVLPSTVLTPYASLLRDIDKTIMYIGYFSSILVLVNGLRKKLNG